MADKKISELTSLTALSYTDELVIVQSGTTYKTTLKDILRFDSKRYTNATVSGSLALDLDTYDTFNLTLTGATTLSITDTLGTDEVKTFTIYVTGDFALTLSGLELWSGTYDGTKDNRITGEQKTDSITVVDIQTKA